MYCYTYKHNIKTINNACIQQNCISGLSLNVATSIYDEAVQPTFVVNVLLLLELYYKYHLSDLLEIDHGCRLYINS